MKVTKPSWVNHTDDKGKRTSIFCIHIHPDCSRLATGGLDTKIRIWSTLPILNEEVEKKADENPKLLCTLGTHNGPVLTVRWAHHGRYLASGSDDGVVLIWDLDPSGGGKVWGSSDVNVESWKPLKRLVGHENDVADVAWSSDDSMIASVGLDSKIFIWDGYTFEKLRMIDQHGGFVKGVCWDPIGEYLATQSDDKTVKIWDTSSWTLVETVSEPFKHSPGNTFFRRLSWSPDGSFIAASNAMNGPVFVAAIIERDQWHSDFSFVGHENTIQVAAFNPRLLFPAGQKPVRGNAQSMVALGGDDNSISIWRNVWKKPLVVLKDLFERQILDLCWSEDGLSIYGCSSDGTICAISFEPEELPELASPETSAQIIQAQRTKASPFARRLPSAPIASAAASVFPNNTIPSDAVINKLTARQKVTILPSGKRRIQPIVVGSLSSTELMNPAVNLTTSTTVNGTSSGNKNTTSSNPFHAPRSSVNARDDRNAMMMEIDNVFGANDEAHGRSKLPEGRTLGGDRPKVSPPVHEIRPSMVAPRSAGVGGSGPAAIILPVPMVQSQLIAKCEEDENVWVEAKNGAEGLNQITMLNRGDTQWLVYAENPIVALAVSQHYVAAAFEDGSLAFFTPYGDRRIPNIRLDSVVSVLHICKHHLMAITAKGTIHAWNVDKRKAHFSPISISHLLAASPSSSSQPQVTISNAVIRPNGTPLIQLSTGSAYVYDANMSVWTEVCSSWWARNSPLWPRAQSRNNSDNSQLFVAGMESALNVAQSDVTDAAADAASKERPEYWNEAISLGHLETRIYACALLDSPPEYKLYLLAYASKLAEEGYKGKAEELVKELHGPVYFNARNDQDWAPTICGLQKRDLLLDVLKIFAKTQTLGDLAKLWRDRLRDAAAERFL